MKTIAAQKRTSIQNVRLLFLLCLPFLNSLFLYLQPLHEWIYRTCPR